MKPDTGNIVPECGAGQAGAKTKCPLSDINNTVRNNDAGQFGAIIECKCSDVGNTIGDRNAGHASTAESTFISGDDGDWKAIGYAGDDYCAARTGVFGDSDRAIIGHESELGLHHSGQRQEQQEQQRFCGAGGL